VRICIIGKFPPIQGGVSMRTYWTAHALAMHGHEIHVVTNAKEALPPFRMYMRPEDWTRCEAAYGSGSVTVHWSDPIDRSQSYIPMASPFVSKLAAIAARVHSEHTLDVIYSHYLEPYGVAAYLAAQITGVPHVARMAGSDAGRLWHHPQLEALYDHVLRSAEVVIAAGSVAERAVERGVAPARIAHGGRFRVPDDLFTPHGPALDLVALRTEAQADRELHDLTWGEFAGDRPYFGVCGKLGENKGSFALLAAMQRLKDAGVDAGLVALAHGQTAAEKSFRARARTLGLTDRILQIPFLPHWRVPEFLRGCLAVCCLEQDFPIGFHTPMIPFEVLMCGSCLVGSTEVIRKLPAYGRLVHRYGCVAIEDVNNVDILSEHLAAIIKDPGPIAAMGARGSAFARELQRDGDFPQTLERILEAAAARQRIPSMDGSSTAASEVSDDDRFPLVQLAEATIGGTTRREGEAATPRPMIDVAGAREILADIERRIGEGETGLEPIVPAIKIEIAIAAAENEADVSGDCDPLFRLHMRRWGLEDSDLAGLTPVCDPRLRLLAFDYDVSEYIGARTIADLPASPPPRPSYVVAWCSDGLRGNPLVVDDLTAETLLLSDGTRTASEIAKELGDKAGPSTETNNLKWIEQLFVHGLISLLDRRVGAACDAGAPHRSAGIATSG
jgi:glycosyltransferase involved in cell wall biosynthesis